MESIGWEYRVVTEGEILSSSSSGRTAITDRSITESLQIGFNNLGRLGWEFTSACQVSKDAPVRFCFKRPRGWAPPEPQRAEASR